MKGDMSRGFYDGVTTGGLSNEIKPYDMHCPQAGGSSGRFNFHKEACDVRKRDPSQFYCFGGCYKEMNRTGRASSSRINAMAPEVEKKANSKGNKMYRRVKGYIDKGLSNKDIAVLVSRKETTIKGYRCRIKSNEEEKNETL